MIAGRRREFECDGGGNGMKFFQHPARPARSRLRSLHRVDLAGRGQAKLPVVAARRENGAADAGPATPVHEDPVLRAHRPVSFRLSSRNRARAERPRRSGSAFLYSEAGVDNWISRPCHAVAHERPEAPVVCGRSHRSSQQWGPRAGPSLHDAAWAGSGLVEATFI